MRTTVEHATDGAVHTIVFSSDDSANYLTVDSMQALNKALEVAHSSNAHVLRIRSDASSFCSGRDQSETPSISRIESLGLILRANKLLTTFSGVSVTEVNGTAYGFGAGLAIQSDLTICGETATLAFDEIDFGLAPLAVAAYLPKYLSEKLAYEMLFTGKRLSASDALGLGLVNDVVSTDSLVSTADNLVTHLLTLEPGALRLLKQFKTEMAGASLQEKGTHGIGILDQWLSDGRPETVSSYFEAL